MTRGEFEAALERYGDMAYRVALSATGCREDAEDAVQEAFLRLYRRERAFEADDHLRFWLIRVTVNECRRAMRWYKRNVPVEELPETAAEEPGNWLLETVLSLPEKLRVAAYLYYYEDFSTRQIARLTQSPEATVRTRLKRAREGLREILTEENV